MIITFVEPEEESHAEVIIMPTDDILEFSEDDEVFDMSGGMELPGGNNSEDGAPSFRLPGASDYVDDDNENEEEETEEVVTDWMNDRDPSHFMDYIKSAYPDGIPHHDGSSTLGCERATMYLVKLNKEISEALRADNDDSLDLPFLENVRVNMVRDIVTLKDHIKKLNKKHKKSKDISQNLVKDAELKKEARSPKIQLIMTPWERAITGMIINSVVSAGKPFEDVYDFLKKKYKFTDREDLAILQLLMDMGHPIFKDRGILGEKGQDNDGEGVDFIRNYFA